MRFATEDDVKRSKLVPRHHSSRLRSSHAPPRIGVHHTAARKTGVRPRRAVRTPLDDAAVRAVVSPRTCDSRHNLAAPRDQACHVTKRRGSARRRDAQHSGTRRYICEPLRAREVVQKTNHFRWIKRNLRFPNRSGAVVPYDKVAYALLGVEELQK